MKSAPKPVNEKERLEALYRYKILDTPAERVFDEITELAAELCDSPVVTITLIDEEREWYKSRVGIEDEQAPRDISFCAHTILQDDLLIIPDTFTDDRFRDNPFVKEDPPLRFYAGAPLKTLDNHALGTLCVIDHVPRELTENQKNLLKILANHVITELELRKARKEQLLAEESLRKNRQQLEIRVKQRTAELQKINNKLLDEITYRQDLEAKLSTSRARFEFALECAGMGIWDYDMNTKHAVWNTQHEKLFGFMPGTYDGTYETFEKRIHPDDLQDYSDAIKKSIINRKQFKHVYRIIWPDGTLHWMEDIGQFVFNPKGVPIRMYGVVNDITLWKQADIHRKALEDRNEALVKALGEIVYVWKPPENIVEWDGEFTQILGYSESEMGTTTGDWTNLIHQADIKHVQEQIDKLTPQQNTLDIEYRFRHRDGSYRWMLDRGVAFFDGNGKLSRIIGVFFDITEQKLFEEKQREMNLALANAMPGISRLDQHGRYITVNDIYADMLGYQPDELTGYTWESTVHPDDRPEAKAAYQKMLDSGKGVFESRAIRKDGSEFYKQVLLVKITDDHGKYTGYHCFMQDISKRKQAECALQRSEEHLRFLYEENPSMYFTISADGKILSVNTFGAEELGYKANELTGKSILRVFPEHEHTRVQAKLYDCLKNFGELLEWEIQKIRKNGDILWVKEAARAVGTPDGGTAILIVCRDITERVQAEEALKTTNRALHVLSQCNDSMIHVNSEQSLLDGICNIIVNTGNYQLAWVGFPNNDKQKTVTPVAMKGDTEYLESIVVTWAEDQHGNGPTGTAIRTGKPEITKNVLNDNKFAPWRNIATKHGFASVVSLPLIYDNNVIGALTIYTTEKNAFNNEELNLLIKLAENLAFGITAQRREKQRKTTEEEVKRSRQRLRNLATRLQFVREEERRNIAREIHDELGQTLTGLKLELSWIQKHLPKNWKAIPVRLQSINSLIDKELETVHDITLRLRPAILDDLGLEAAIESEVLDLAKRMGCNCSIKLDNDKIAKNIERDTTVFRILQEALTNIARHAKANNIQLSLNVEDKDLVLEIKDDGIGIQNEKITSPDSLGLIGMYERVLSVVMFRLIQSGKAVPE